MFLLKIIIINNDKIINIKYLYYSEMYAYIIQYFMYDVYCVVANLTRMYNSVYIIIRSPNTTVNYTVSAKNPMTDDAKLWIDSGLLTF